METPGKNINWQKCFLEIAELLPDANVWIKNKGGRFVMANRNFLEMTGLKSMEDLINKTDADVWPSHLVETYVQGDQKVIGTGVPIIGQIELMKNSQGVIEWFSTTKIPIHDDSGKIMGAGGFTINLNKSDSKLRTIMEMAPAIEYMMDHYSEKIEMKKLAYIMGMSISSFERKFKAKFKTTPMRYLSRIRLEAASQLLVKTGRSISEIAYETGYYDQSHFSKHFREFSGKYPSQYRAEFAGETD